MLRFLLTPNTFIELTRYAMAPCLSKGCASGIVRFFSQGAMPR